MTTARRTAMAPSISPLGGFQADIAVYASNAGGS
jgi:hypothetical protein